MTVTDRTLPAVHPAGHIGFGCLPSQAKPAATIFLYGTTEGPNTTRHARCYHLSDAVFFKK
jgi:hypothetical protein